MLVSKLRPRNRSRRRPRLWDRVTMWDVLTGLGRSIRKHRTSRRVEDEYELTNAERRTHADLPNWGPSLQNTANAGVTGYRYLSQGA